MKFVSRLAAIVALAPVSAFATTVGLSTDPAGSAWDRGDANTAYGTFDSFPTFQFTDAAVAGSGFTTPQLDQATALTVTVQGGGLYAGSDTGAGTVPSNGDVFFGGGNLPVWTFTATTSFDVKGFYLQVKRPGSTAGFAASGTSTGMVPVLTVGGNSFSPDGSWTTSGTGDTNSPNPGNWSVVTYAWGPSLASTASSTISLTITGPSQRLIDGFAFDAGSVAGAVPEPATVGLLTVGGLLALRRRRVAL